MSKWGLFAGVVAAGVLLYNFQTNRVTVVDVLSFLAENSGDEIQLAAEDFEDQKRVANNEDEAGPGFDKKSGKMAAETKSKAAIEEAYEDRDLSILAFGDIMLGRHVRVLMDKNGADYIFGKMEGPEKMLTEGADVIFGNLEGPISGKGTKGGTSMVFSFNEDVAQLLKDFGFTLLSVSNNHALDKGWNGRDTTVKALESAGLGWCGHPKDADPASVYYGNIGESKYAFVCFQDITHKLDDEAAVELIKSIRPEVDYLVVSIHWGIEYKNKPDFGLQIQPAHDFIDAGADFIIGHHPHVVQSFEVYNGRVVFYSLGNFVFDQYWSKGTQEELAIGIVLDDFDEDDSLRTKVRLFPMKSEKAQSRLMTEKERSEWIERFIGYGIYDEETKKEIRDGVIEVP